MRNWDVERNVAEKMRLRGRKESKQLTQLAARVNERFFPVARLARQNAYQGD